jgi:hypothetical protein
MMEDGNVHVVQDCIKQIANAKRLDRTRVTSSEYGALPLVILAAFDDRRLKGRTPCLALAALLMVAALLDQTANLHRIHLAQADWVLLAPVLRRD